MTTTQDQNTPTNTLEELREQILTEFKQVHRLAPADYTENCTNVVMSLVSQVVNKARLNTLYEVAEAVSKEPLMNQWVAHYIRELETPKQVEETE